MQAPNGGGTSGTHGNGSGGIQKDTKSTGSESLVPNGGGTSGTQGNGSAGKAMKKDTEPTGSVSNLAPNGGGTSGSHGNNTGG
jgi:hypothetical protein